MPCTLLWDSATDRRHTGSTPVVIVPDRAIASSIWPLIPSSTNNNNNTTTNTNVTTNTADSNSCIPDIAELPPRVRALLSPQGSLLSDPHASHIQRNHPLPSACTARQLSWYFAAGRRPVSTSSIHESSTIGTDTTPNPNTGVSPGSTGKQTIRLKPSSTTSKGLISPTNPADVTLYAAVQDAVADDTPLVGSVRYDLVLGVHVTRSQPPATKTSVKAGVKRFLKFIASQPPYVPSPPLPVTPQSRLSVTDTLRHGGGSSSALSRSALPSASSSKRNSTLLEVPRSPALPQSPTSHNASLRIHTRNLSNMTTDSEMRTAIASSAAGSDAGRFPFPVMKPPQRSYLTISCLHFKHKINNTSDTNDSNPDAKDNAQSRLQSFSSQHRHLSPQFRQIVFMFDDDEDVYILPPTRDSNGVLGPPRKVLMVDRLLQHLTDCCIPFDTVDEDTVDDVLRQALISCSPSAISAETAIAEAQEIIESLTAKQKAVITHVRQRKRRIHILVNPFGGTGKAATICSEEAEPMIKLAGLPYVVEFTKRRYHAADITRELNFKEIRSIVTVSGDGLFHEVVNGILTRPDWDKARRQISLGTIGAGTSNAMAKNLDSLTTAESTFAVIKSKKTPMDVFSCVQKGEVTYSHLSVTWTLIADLDIESEKYRWMGSFRIIFGALLRLVNMRSYMGTIYLLPTEDKPSQVEGSEQSTEQQSDAVQPTQNYGSNQSQYQELKYTGPRLKFTADPLAHRSWPIVVSDSFSLFIATNLPFISSEFFTSPFSKFGDGKMDVIYTNSVNRMHMLNSISDQESGKFVFAPGIQLEHVRAFVIEPGPRTSEPEASAENMENNYIISVSGERYPYDTIRVEVHPQCLQLLCPFWLNEDEWLNQFEQINPDFVKIPPHVRAKTRVAIWAEKLKHALAHDE